MYRLKLVLFTALTLLGLSVAVYAQKKNKKIPDKPETTLRVPTLTLPEDTIFVDFSKPAPTENTSSMIPMESSLTEEQKNPKKIVIVPAPPPPPGKDPIPPKYPDRKPNE